MLATCFFPRVFYIFTCTHLYGLNYCLVVYKQAGFKSEVPVGEPKITIEALPEYATFRASWSIPSLARRYNHLRDLPEASLVRSHSLPQLNLIFQ